MLRRVSQPLIDRATPVLDKISPPKDTRIKIAKITVDVVESAAQGFFAAAGARYWLSPQEISSSSIFFSAPTTKTIVGEVFGAPIVISGIVTGVANTLLKRHVQDTTKRYLACAVINLGTSALLGATLPEAVVTGGLYLLAYKSWKTIKACANQDQGQKVS
jgi:hypothetical protein